MIRNTWTLTWTCWSNIILVKCCVYAQKFDTLQWLTVTAEIELLLNMVWRFVVYCVQLPVCWIFCLPWLFSLFVCHSPSQSWTFSIGLVSLESRSRSWTSKSWSWSWSWNCWVLVLVLNLRVLVLVLVLDKQVLVLVLVLEKQVLNPSQVLISGNVVCVWCTAEL